ncbi:hypothetical protein [Chitinimonas koreensis]|nr:hypothetical protein [Chitinimonas koreensis]
MSRITSALATPCHALTARQRWQVAQHARRYYRRLAAALPAGRPS